MLKICSMFLLCRFLCLCLRLCVGTMSRCSHSLKMCSCTQYKGDFVLSFVFFSFSVFFVSIFVPAPKWVHALITEETLCLCLCLSVSLSFLCVFVPAPKWVHALITEETLCFCLCLSVSLSFFVSVFVPAPKWVHALITEERWFHPFTSTGPITTQQVALHCTAVKLLLHETNNLPMKKSTGPITARCSAV